MTARQANDFTGHHHAHDGVRQPVADTDTVGQQEVALQFGQTIGGDTGLRQLAKAGIDSLDHRAAVKNTTDGMLGVSDGVPRALIQG